MKSTLTIVAMLGLVCVGRLFAAEKSTVVEGSTKSGGNHSNASASYSITKTGPSTVVIHFEWKFSSLQNRGGGKGAFRLTVLDGDGKAVYDKYQTETIGNNPLHGNKNKSGHDDKTLFGPPAEKFISSGGSVTITALPDREGSAIPHTTKDLKEFYKSVTGAEWGSAQDTQNKGMAAAIISGL